jgi:general stress protein YciG
MSGGSVVQEGPNRRKTIMSSKRGFAAMNPEQHRSISVAGGKAAHAKGTGHEFTSEEAREAGRRGGQKTAENRKHMSEIGRKGANARNAARENEEARR